MSTLNFKHLRYFWAVAANGSIARAAEMPALVERICCVCGTARTSPHNRLFLLSLRQALTADRHWNGAGFDAPPEQGLRTYALIYASWAASQPFFRNLDVLVGVDAGVVFGWSALCSALAVAFLFSAFRDGHLVVGIGDHTAIVRLRTRPGAHLCRRLRGGEPAAQAAQVIVQRFGTGGQQRKGAGGPYGKTGHSHGKIIGHLHVLNVALRACAGCPGHLS